MLIEVTKKVPGCKYHPGTTLDLPEKRAAYMIEAGLAVPVGEKIDYGRKSKRRLPKSKKENEHMRPPMHICSCGFVGKDDEMLKVHRIGCGSKGIKLNLGCGPDIKEGYVNIDIRELEGVDIVHDVANLAGLRLSGVKYILADDILEHFPQEEAERVLSHWVSLLIIGGVIEIRCPDILHAVEVRLSDEWLIRLIYGGQDYPQNYHKAGFTLATMRTLLEKLNMEVISEENTKEGNMVVKAKK